jgi:predicted transcriptional regulator
MSNLAQQPINLKANEEYAKKATLKEVAKFLGVSESAVKQYKKEKRILMQLGLPIYLKKTKTNSKSQCDELQ